MNRLIIGLSGYKGSGKDTICKMILPEFADVYAVRMAFADNLKQEIANICKLTLADIEANKSLFRPMLQWWGTDYRRKYCKNDNYWVDKLEEHLINNTISRLIFITDVRYMNEVNLIKYYRGEIWKIIRYGSTIDPHSSETSLDNYTNFDRVIINTDTLDRLKEVVLTEIVPEIRRKL